MVSPNDPAAALERSESAQKAAERVRDVTLAGIPIDPEREVQHVRSVVVPEVVQMMADEQAERTAANALQLGIFADTVGAVTVSEPVAHKAGATLVTPSAKPLDGPGLTAKIANNHRCLTGVIDARDSVRSTAVIALGVGLLMAVVGFGGVLALIATSQGLFEEATPWQWGLAATLALSLLIAGIALAFFKKGAPTLRPAWASAAILGLVVLFFVRYIALGAAGDPDLEAAWRTVWNYVLIGSDMGIAASAIVLELAAGTAMTMWWAYISSRPAYAEAAHLAAVCEKYQKLREKIAIDLAHKQSEAQEQEIDVVALACNKLAGVVFDALKTDQVRVQQAMALKGAPPTGAYNESIDWDVLDASIRLRREAAEDLRRLGAGGAAPAGAPSPTPPAAASSTAAPSP